MAPATEFDWPAYWLTPVQYDLRAALAASRVTIRELACEAGITLKRVRQVRAAGPQTMTRNDAAAYHDFVRAIATRNDPERAACVRLADPRSL